MRLSRMVSCLAVVYVAAIGLLIVSADSGEIPWILSFYRYIPFGDQVGHFFLMGLLSLAFNYVFRFKRMGASGHSPFVGAVVVAALITVEECSQIFIASRSFSLADLAANYAGIVFFGHFVSGYMSRRRESVQSQAE